MPVVKFSEEEQNIWNHMKTIAEDDEAAFVEATEKLLELRENGQTVSALTSELISFEDF